MHTRSLELMEKTFVKHYLKRPGLTILDIGALDINGTYRHLFKEHSYTGADLQPGPNVDIVLPHPYEWNIGQWDVVISGQVLEHTEDMTAFMHAVANALKPGGITCHIAPWSWNEHRYPVDCWRIFPDGMSWLFRNSQLIEILTRKDRAGNTIGIAQKG